MTGLLLPLSADTVTEYAWVALRPVLTATGRWIVPSAQVDAVHAHFGTAAVEYGLDDRATIVGDAVHAVALALVAEANRR